MGTSKDTYLSFSGDAEITASIRDEAKLYGEGESAFRMYDSKSLFNIQDGRVDFSLGSPSDEDLDGKFKLSLSGHHLENEDDGQFYHNRIEMFITKKDLANIVKFAQFLIDADLEDEE